MSESIVKNWIIDTHREFDDDRPFERLDRQTFTSWSDAKAAWESLPESPEGISKYLARQTTRGDEVNIVTLDCK